ncbi:MAG: hypothetical protein RR483_01360 [Clostridia bacterium]
MKNAKKIVSSILAISVAASTVVFSTVAQAQVDSLKVDEEMSFANYLDFEKWESDVDLKNESKGLKNAPETNDIYAKETANYQVKSNAGAENSKGFVMSEKIGKDKATVWSAMRFGDDPEDNGLSTDHFNFSQMGALGGSEYVFYIDLTNYKKYKLIVDEETEDVLGREDEAKPAPYSPFVGVWDLGTSVGENRSAYVPKSDSSFYIQTENGSGGNNWTEALIKNEGYITIPKNYKGYVRIPRTSMVTIWGAHGDVISDKDNEDIGDHLFNGPFEYLTFNGNSGGLEYEGAVKSIDNLGFIAYDFDENINSVSVKDIFKETQVVTSEDKPITSNPPVTSEEITETPAVTSEEVTQPPVDDTKELKYLNLINFEGLANDFLITNTTPGMDKTESAFIDFFESEAGKYIIKDGVGANGSKGLKVENYLGNLEHDQYVYAAGWSKLAFAPTFTDPTNCTGFVPDLFSAAEIGKASEFAFWIDTTQYTKYKTEVDEDDNFIGRDDQPQVSSFTHWLGIWDRGTIAGEGTTCYAVEKGKSVLLQDGANWISFEQTKGGNNFNLPKGYKGYVRIPRTSMEGIWGAYGDIRADEEGKYLDGDVPILPRGDGFFNGPIERISFNGNVGGYEYEGASFVLDDIGFIGEKANFLNGLTLMDMPSVGEEITSEDDIIDSSTPDNDNSNNDDNDDNITSTPNTSNPNSGTTGISGAVSAVAIAVLAAAGAICFKKRK